MKFLPRVCDPSLFFRLPGTQFPVSMIHIVNMLRKKFQRYFSYGVTFSLKVDETRENH